MYQSVVRRIQSNGGEECADGSIRLETDLLENTSLRGGRVYCIHLCNVPPSEGIARYEEIDWNMVMLSPKLSVMNRLIFLLRHEDAKHNLSTIVIPHLDVRESLDRMLFCACRYADNVMPT
eukprot:PhF_6_TR698/c0_g1_i3/m.1133